MNKSLLFGILSLLLQITCPAQELERFEYAIPKMGTTFRIIFYTDDQELARKIFRKCGLRLEQLDQVFSDYRTNSEAHKISNSSCSGKWQDVSDDMWSVLSTAVTLGKASNGVFDVSIGPLSKLWRHAIRRKKMPDASDLKMAKNKVGLHLIELDEQKKRVKLKTSGMQLDFGAIAKGYAVDELYHLLKSEELSSILIDGGGDLRVGNAPPGEAGWKIHLSSNGETMYYTDRAIASSGSTFRYLNHEGATYSHIVNPLTGRGVIDGQIVTVAAKDCSIADAFASIAFILGKEKVVEIVNLFPEVEVL